MKNITDHPELCSLELVYKDYLFGMSINTTENSYRMVATLEFENEQEIKNMIQGLKRLLKKGEDNGTV